MCERLSKRPEDCAALTPPSRKGDGEGGGGGEIGIVPHVSSRTGGNEGRDNNDDVGNWGKNYPSLSFSLPGSSRLLVSGGGEGGGWFEFIINGIVIIRREDKSWERRKSQEWRERENRSGIDPSSLHFWRPTDFLSRSCNEISVNRLDSVTKIPLFLLLPSTSHGTTSRLSAVTLDYHRRSD